MQQRENNSGSAHFGGKDMAYLKKISRSAVENITNTSVLFFAVDYEKSKRNFYGEMLIRMWVNPLGIEVRGIINLEEGAETNIGDIQNKILKLDFSCYISHLKELGIDPQIGDYFSTKNRIYMIYGKSILDANQVSVGTDREALYCNYHCIESDNEQLTPPGSYNNTPEGTKNEITGQRQF